jgi:hypothetical protein
MRAKMLSANGQDHPRVGAVGDRDEDGCGDIRTRSKLGQIAFERRSGGRLS